MADYVIVGAGSAGCVLAEKLSTRSSVTLIEAGGSDRAAAVAIPAAYPKLFKGPRDWGFQTQPEPGANHRTLFLPRGRMVGGSSSMNAGLYIRGRPSDYDGWERLGATGWGWDAVLEVFKGMEGNSRGRDDYHGDSGPLLVSDLRSPNPLSRRFIEAAVAAGIPPNRDFNGPDQEGVGPFQVTQKRGRRWSAADAYLRPALGRPTLEVLTETTVSRVVVDHGRAVGVECRVGTESRVVTADREVILAAGAFGSPHLLQVSGIGDPDHLGDIGVDAVVSNPEVGLNLQDHPVVGAIYDSLQPGTLDDAETPLELARWALLRKGRLTSPIAEVGIFVRSSPDKLEPDLQFHFGPANFDGHGIERYEGHAFSFGPVLVNPVSRGSLRAVSPDVTDAPAIVTNCLTAEAEIEALVNGMELARDIANQSALDRYRGREHYPGPGVRTRGEMAEFIRDRVELIYHPVGTCRMGSDETAVVDSSLRVNGVDGLRVADASVMPGVTSGNTNAPTMMIAARAAEMILAGQPSNGSSS